MSREHVGIICEGQLDAIACHEAGIENVVASQGTAFTPEHARLLKRYTDNIILCFDDDAGGHKANARAFRELAGAGLNVRVIALPDGQDPDSLIKRDGPDAFRELVSQAREFFDYFLRHRAQSAELSEPAEVGRVLNDLAPLVASVGDKGVKEASINLVANRLGIGQSAVRDAVVGAERRAASMARRPSRPRPGDDGPPAQTPPTPLDRSVAYLCQFSLQSHQVLDWLCEQTEPLLDAIEGRDGAELLRFILAKRPDAGNPHSVNTFLSGLDAPDQAALLSVLQERAPSDPLKEAAATLAGMSLANIQRQIDALHAKLKDPNLTPEALASYQREAAELLRLSQTARNP
jgi:DNA primase